MNYREQTSDVGYSTTKAAPKSYVNETLEYVFSALERQDKLLTILEEKIYSVLGPDYPTKDGSVNPASSDTSPLVNTLDGVRQGIVNNSDRLSSLIDRIQL